MNKLLNDLAIRCPGGQLPQSYLVIDIETSGFSVQKNRIVQLGACPVFDGEVKQESGFSLLIKRPRGTMTRGAMEVTGITDEMLMEKGMDPVTALEHMLALFEDFRGKGFMFIGHNLAGFDVPFYEAEFRRENLQWKFREDEIFDTGTIVKALQLGATVLDGESLRTFFMRVKEIWAKGVYWALDKYCVPTFQLVSRYGIDVGKHHDAAYDCYVTALILEDIKRLASVAEHDRLENAIEAMLQEIAT